MSGPEALSMDQVGVEDRYGDFGGDWRGWPTPVTLLHRQVVILQGIADLFTLGMISIET